MSTATATKSFAVNGFYFCRSFCDHNCVWTFKVIRRTAKSIWIAPVRNGEVLTDETSRKSIKVGGGYGDSAGYEMVNPLGSYSMSPILGADSPCE